jgi:hypothetical protein
MMQLTVCGIPRSGSTLVWQLLQALFPDIKVGQTHPGDYTSDGSFYFATIRNPFDVAASRYRVRLSRDPSSGGRPGMKAELAFMRTTYAGLDRVLAEPQVHLLRYEHFYCNYNEVFDAVETRLSRAVTHRERVLLEAEYSLGMNTMRAASQENFLKWDDKMIHGDHIGAVIPGSWSYLENWQKKMIQDEVSDIADEWGYLS